MDLARFFKDPGIDLAFQRHVMRWNTIIPKSAVKTEPWGLGRQRYLHPTKGWRYISNSRLGM